MRALFILVALLLFSPAGVQADSPANVGDRVLLVERAIGIPGHPTPGNPAVSLRLPGGTTVTVNVAIMRTFVKLREMLATHKDLAQKLEALEKKYDRQFKVVFDAIRQLMKPEEPPKQQRIGF